MKLRILDQRAIYRALTVGTVLQDAGAAAGLGATTRSFSIDTAAPATSAQKGALMLRNVTFDIATISATKAPIW